MVVARREKTKISEKFCSIGKLQLEFCSVFFPTCQVRVVRFYQSACPPPPPPSSSASSSSSTSCPPRPLPRLRLFHLQFRLAPPPLPPCQLCQLVAKLFANCPAQCGLLDVNLRAAQLSAHCWTSTCKLPSSMCTAGPQPGTCPAQCAPLDLNRGPAQLSVHRWTSTGGLPSSVCTAGPQPGTCPAQCAPLDLNGQIECQKICQMECQIECQKSMPDKML